MTRPATDLRSDQPDLSRARAGSPLRGAGLPAAVAVLGLAYAATAYGYDVGSLSAPGPGALPFAVGVFTALVGGVLAIGALTRPRASAAPAGTEESAELTSRFGPGTTLAIVVVTCVFIIWQSRIIGLLPATGVGTAVLAWTLRARLATAVLTGLGFYLAAYLLFDQWLEVPLPRGYF